MYIFVNIFTQKQEIEKMREEQEKKEDSKKGKHKKVYSTVGTPDYIALEVLYQKGICKIKYPYFLEIYYM